MRPFDKVKTIEISTEDVTPHTNLDTTSTEPDTSDVVAVSNDETDATAASEPTSDSVDVVEVIEADIIEKQAEDEHNKLEDGIKTLDQLTDVEQELTESIIRDELDDTRTVEQSMEELFIICDKYGLPCALTSTFGTEAFDATSISLESIVEEKKELIEKVKKTGLRVLAGFKETLSSFGSAYTLLSKYRADKLRILKTKIESGELVPRKEVDTKANDEFNKKLGVFHAFGYTASGKTGDLISFMKIPVDNANSDFYNTYTKFVKDNLLATKGEKIDKDKPSSNFIAKLKDVEFSIDPKSDEFKTGFVMRYFSDTVSIVSITQNDDEELSADLHTDLIKIKEVEEIKPASKQDVIKLLDFGIGTESDIQKAASSIKSKLLPTVGSQLTQLASTAALAAIGYTIGGVAAGALVKPAAATGTGAAIATNPAGAFVKKAGYNLFSSTKAALTTKTGTGIALAGSATAGLLVSKRIARYLSLGQRFNGNLSNHLVAVSKDLLRYDSFIAEYISLTYEKPQA